MVIRKRPCMISSAPPPLTPTRLYLCTNSRPPLFSSSRPFRLSLVPKKQTNKTWNRQRAALDLFRESKGEVLLMAVMRDMRNVPGDPEFANAAAAAAATATATTATTAASGDQCGGASMDDSERIRTKSDATEPTGAAPSRRGLGSKVGSAGRVSGSSADSRGGGRSGGGGGGGGGGGKNGNSFMHASIFPGENFSFVWQCNVLVLAEDKEKALFHLGQLQAKVWRGDMVAQRSQKDSTPPLGDVPSSFPLSMITGRARGRSHGSIEPWCSMF